MSACCELDHQKQMSLKFESKCKIFLSWKCIWKCCLLNISHFVQTSMSYQHLLLSPEASMVQPYLTHHSDNTLHIFSTSASYSIATFEGIFLLHKVVNSLDPGRFGCNVNLVNLKLISRIDIFSIYCGTDLRWLPQDLTNERSTFVQVMPNGLVLSGNKPSPEPINVEPDLCFHVASSITRPQWVKTLKPEQNGHQFTDIFKSMG